MKDWLSRHVFRTVTAALTLVLLGASFFYSPDLLTWWLRAMMRVIEGFAALFPYPWGDRIEIAMKALGGSFWFLITSAIIAIRMLFSGIALGWRHGRSPRRLPPPPT